LQCTSYLGALQETYVEDIIAATDRSHVEFHDGSSVLRNMKTP